MIKGFKEFILRGNVIDLAVAVVIGGAFTAVVNAIVGSVITPLVSLFYVPNESGTVGPTFTGLYGQEVTFPLGDLLTALISFFAVAIVVYLVFVVPMNKWKELQAAKAAKAGIEDEGAADALPSEQQLLVQIRDLLQKNETRSTQP
jgi:large conductance mechanosensitive channel